MPRSPQLKKKRIGNSTYWHTKAGGQDMYFGNVKDVPHKQAHEEFTTHIKSLSDGTAPNNRLSCHALMELFLEWIQDHRSERTFDQRRRDCERFANFKVGNVKVADIPATKIEGQHLEAWLKYCQDLGESPQTVLHRQTSIKHCWNWGSKHPSPTPYLTPTFRPFTAVEKVHTPRKALSEGELITDDEAQILFEAARLDLDNLSQFRPTRPTKENTYVEFSDMLQAYYHTGARTSELVSVQVGDVQLRTQQVTLGQHKTSKTQREQYVRTLTLNKKAMGIFNRHCRGKKINDHVFNNSDGNPWTRRSVSERFARVKEVAKERGLGEVRDHITIYDFRHLWISETLMAGNDIATVARMAGTSVAMIERVYGHFRNEHLQEAQARLDALRQKRAAQSS